VTVGDLRVFDSVILDGSGNGFVKLGPKGAREVWRPDLAAVAANANPTNEAKCNIFVGDVNAQRFVDSTVNGSSGDSTGKISGKKVKINEFVWAYWTGGDAGQRATLTVLGEMDV
jgi:hypothetical protein